MKVVITGPESAGKSILSSGLANVFKGNFVDEYARSYVENLESHYQYSDVEHIARHQLMQYDILKYSKGFTFFDTYMIITKIWFLHVYNKIPSWFESEFIKRPVDLYLLCKPDLVWVDDGIRENEDKRDLLFSKYKNELDNYGFDYEIIEGFGEKRLDNAVKIINKRKLNL